MTAARWPVLITAVCLGLAVARAAAVGGESREAGKQFAPPLAPAQPLPFSHRAHLLRALTCETCHTMPDGGEAATLPPTATCMRCHAKLPSDGPLQLLKSAHEQGRPIAWERVYRNPPFVRFSHRAHLPQGAVEAACTECHGPVREMTVMRQVADISMAACVSCHQERKAPITCAATCHGEMARLDY